MTMKPAQVAYRTAVNATEEDDQNHQSQLNRILEKLAAKEMKQSQDTKNDIEMLNTSFRKRLQTGVKGLDGFGTEVKQSLLHLRQQVAEYNNIDDQIVTDVIKLTTLIAQLGDKIKGRQALLKEMNLQKLNELIQPSEKYPASKKPNDGLIIGATNSVQVKVEATEIGESTTKRALVGQEDMKLAEYYGEAECVLEPTIKIEHDDDDFHVSPSVSP